jgi:hypothetical protein
MKYQREFSPAVFRSQAGGAYRLFLVPVRRLRASKDVTLVEYKLSLAYLFSQVHQIPPKSFCSLELE